MAGERRNPTTEEIDTATQEWRQGDVADIQRVIHLGHRTAGLVAAKDLMPDQAGPVCVMESETESLVLMSQTCDVVRSCKERPIVELAPLVRLEATDRDLAAKGLMPRYAAVPGMGNDAFADLDQRVSIDKAVLTEAGQQRGCPTVESARRFARLVGRKYSRPAFSEDVALSLARLTDRIREKHDRQSPEGAALRTLAEIRITTDPDPASPRDLFLHFILPPEPESIGISDEEWDGQVDTWLGLCEPTGSVQSVEGIAIRLNDMSAEEYVNSDPLDVDQLTR